MHLMKLDQIDKTTNKIRFFSATLAIGLSIVYLICRLKMDSLQINLVLSFLGISLFLICFPDFYFYCNGVLICFLNFILIVTAGLFTSVTGINISLLFIALGFISWQFTLYYFIRTNRLIRITFLIIIFFAFSLWLAGMAWGLSFQTPLLLENLSIDKAHLDSLFNSAISSMIKTYGIPSTGLDGTPYIYYHWGSHWIFAQMSNLLQITPLLFYQLGYPIIFLPLFFNIFLYFVVEIRKTFKIAQNLTLSFWILLIIGFIGFFPISITGVLDRILYFSESYLLSIIFSLFLFSFVLIFFRHKRFSSPTFVFIIPIFIGIIGLLKVSTMYLIFSLSLFLLIRLKLYNNKKYVLLFILSSLLCFTIYKLVNSEYYSSVGMVYFFYFLKTSITPHWKQYFLLTNYYTFFIYCFFRLRQEKIITLADLWRRLKNRQLIDIEILFVLSFFGFLPGNILMITGGSSIYFLDFQRWISLAFLLAFAPTIFPRIPKIKLKGFPIKYFFFGIILAPFLLSFVNENYKMPIRNLFYQNALTQNNYLSQINKGDLVASNRNMIITLQKLYYMNPQEKKKTLLYIPISNRTYWKMLDCLSTSFIAPSLTGMAMLNGYPPHVCQVDAFGYEGYQKNESAVDKAPLETKDLCAKTTKLGFSKIIIVKSNRAEDMKKIRCL